MEKHVGKSDHELLDRLAGPKKISGASSFADRATAEKVVRDLIDDHAADIAYWRDSAKARLTIGGDAGEIVGRYVVRGASSAQNVSGVLAVLVRDARLPTGYRIQTAFPTP